MKPTRCRPLSLLLAALLVAWPLAAGAAPAQSGWAAGAGSLMSWLGAGLDQVRALVGLDRVAAEARQAPANPSGDGDIGSMLDPDGARATTDPTDDSDIGSMLDPDG
jgi:hypothetical protein